MINLRGVGEKTLAAFKKLDINTAEELLFSLPKAYMDLSSAQSIEWAEDGSFCLSAMTVEKKYAVIKRGRLTIFKARARYKNLSTDLVWYNQIYPAKVLEEGVEYNFYGKVKRYDGRIEMTNPLFEKSGESLSDSRFAGIQPVYRTAGLISQRTYHSIVKEGLKACLPVSVISPAVEKKHKLISLEAALFGAHIPQSLQTKQYSDRVLLERLVKRMAAFRLAKEGQKRKRRYGYKFDIDNYARFLPFTLSKSQISAIEKLAADMQSERPLNAILCGDVGSGKTAVAAVLALYARDNGFQSAIIAPTELLAAQHYKTLLPVCRKGGAVAELVTGAVAVKERKRIAQALADGKVDILIGTHAVLGKGTAFKNLGFAVIDEQHRFGVAQRTSLIDKGTNADVLTLSATPIPRSMQLAAYGDIDYVTIDRRFESNTVTALVAPEKREQMWRYLYEECVVKNRQAFVVASRVEDAEGVDLDSAEKLYDELAEFIPAARLGLCHGRMPATKKAQELAAFAKNETGILVSTTVVEVGIDVPDAQIMIIMDAENYGLATLHQLRGRVGRKGQRAYCFLYTAKEAGEGLTFLTKTADGGAIAEKDFDLRGSGDILGLNQSGTGTLKGLTLSSLKLAKSITDEIALSDILPMLKAEINEFSLQEVSLT